MGFIFLEICPFLLGCQICLHIIVSSESVIHIAVVLPLRCVRLFVISWVAARQACLSFTIFQRLNQTHLHWVNDAIQPSHHPLLLLPSIFSRIRVFSSESALCIRWPKYWSFSSSPANEYSGLMSFRIDWFDLLALQRTLKSLLQHYSLKASVHRCSAFFMVQLSHLYTTTGETTALTRWTFVGKLMSLLFNMLSRFVIAFLLRSKCLLISWLPSLSTVILEPKKIVCHCSHFFPMYLLWKAMGPDAMILVLWTLF